MQNPFAPDIHEPALRSVPEVHQGSLDALLALADRIQQSRFDRSGAGCSVWLSAPRAGYGKTHLLSRLEALAMGRWTWIPLDLSPGRHLGWKDLTLRMIASLGQSPANPGFTSGLDETAWFAFSRLVRAGIGNGTVLTEDAEASRSRLDGGFREIFAPSGTESRAAWFAAAADKLLASSASALAEATGCHPEALDFWVRRLRDHAYPAAPPEERLDRLVSGLREAEGDDADWKERFRALARLASGVRPVIWIADHLDPFFIDPQAARRLVHLLSEAVAMVPRSLLVISANEDTWRDVLMPGVPGALRDRLAGEEIALGAISLGEAEQILLSRLADTGRDDEEIHDFLRRLDLPGQGPTISLYPRAILRHANRAWEQHARSPVPATAPEARPSTSPGSRSARDRLHALAEAIRLQSGPPEGGFKPAAPEPGPVAPLAVIPFRTSAPLLPRPLSLAEQFQSLRLRALSEDADTFDWKRMRRLVGEIGDRFPSIRQSTLDLGPDVNGEALSWTVADREIHLGFAPPASDRFWRQLVAGALRQRNLTGPLRPCKVVMPVPFGESVPLDRVTAGLENGGAPEGFVEVLPVDSQTGASLQAAEALLQALRRGDLDCRESQLFGFLAKELDFFWRRLTRLPRRASTREEPVGPVASS